MNNAVCLFIHQIEGNKYKPVVVNRETLMSLDSNLVIVCQWPEPLRYRYFKNLVPELQMTSCSSCFKVRMLNNKILKIIDIRQLEIPTSLLVRHIIILNSRSIYFILKIFHVDDYELEVLQKGFCPFCRIVPEEHASLFTNDWCFYLYFGSFLRIRIVTCFLFFICTVLAIKRRIQFSRLLFVV